MSRASALTAFASRQWTARSVPWIGAVLIGVIVVLAATDIVRGDRVSVEETGRELETRARTIAEQTARRVLTGRIDQNKRLSTRVDRKLRFFSIGCLAA